MSRNDRWFRHYERMVDSPQICELNDSEKWALIELWTLASKSEIRGEVPYTMVSLKKIIRIDNPEMLPEYIQHLEQLDLLEKTEVGWKIPRWDKHQYLYDSQKPENVNERVKEHRARKNTKKSVSDDAVTNVKQQCNDNVTTSNEFATTVDTDTDKDKEIEITPTVAKIAKTGRGSEAKLIWSAFALEIGAAPDSEAGRGAWNSGIKQLQDIGLTAEDIPGLCHAYRTRWPGIDLTPMAVAKNHYLLVAPLPDVEPTAFAGIRDYLKELDDAG